MEDVTENPPVPAKTESKSWFFAFFQLTFPNFRLKESFFNTVMWSQSVIEGDY